MREASVAGSIRRASLVLACVGVLVAFWSGPAAAETFVVKNVDSGGAGSLRGAIQKANGRAGADEIRFGVPRGSDAIVPKGPLPAITDPVTIDGYTQRGAHPNERAVGNDAVLKVRINGAKAGRGADGLRIEAPDTTVKGLVINRFGGDGVLVRGAGATGNRIEGNFIGTDQTGNVDHANGGAGVRISGAPDNTVGGTAPAQRNLISFNKGDGVRVEDARATGNRVVSNSVSRNGGLAIDLAGGDQNANGVTANDEDDADTGANNLQNFPVVDSATRVDGQTTTRGTLSSAPGQSFTVECFAAGGQILAGRQTVTADLRGDAPFECTSGAPEDGQAVTATATNSLTGDTSELSPSSATVR